MPDFITDIQLEEARLNKEIELNEHQKEQVKLYANRAKLDVQMCIDWVEAGQVTMQELASGILWTKVAFYNG